ncbi:MAG: hypothetical protein KME52_30955 [Desmonostoc geniculatum HA4340-LM1]|jgi:hypothetical protein|nr:hypothetical protein [Desmonostoc geniculatum HA4340-LM1]
MSQKVLSVKVDPDDWEWFKELAKDYKTQAEAFKALKQVYQDRVLKPVKALSDNEVDKSVCVSKLGDKLPPQWELKSAIEETIKNRKWYVFPDDRVVAITQKSANGAKRWLEVAAEYSDEIWHEAKTDNRFKYQPVTTLNRALAEYQDRLAKMQHPAIAQALADGWQTTKWHWGLPDLVREAEDYLQMLNPCVCDTSDQPGHDLKLTRDALADRLAPKHISLSTAKTERGRLNTLKDLPQVLTGIGKNKIAQWTTERDPEGLTWEPIDESREYWVTSLH